MLKWLFGNRNEAATGDDHVWLSDSARLKGLRQEVGRLAGAGRSVVVVAPNKTTLLGLLAALSDHQPLHCESLFERNAFLRRLGEAGSVTVALASALPPAVKPVSQVQVEILVQGRNEKRTAEEAITRFANAIGPRARLTFHLSLEDPLLKRHSGDIKPVLEKLGISEDEPIAHPFVTQSIARVQSK